MAVSGAVWSADSSDFVLAIGQRRCSPLNNILILRNCRMVCSTRTACTHSSLGFYLSLSNFSSPITTLADIRGCHHETNKNILFLSGLFLKVSACLFFCMEYLLILELDEKVSEISGKNLSFEGMGVFPLSGWAARFGENSPRR